MFKILQKNATLNPDKVNIVPLPYAISKEKEEFFFISSEASFGNGGISTTKESTHGRFVHSEKIKGVNLSHYIKEEYPQWLEKLSFIKIDTEGYDKEIIKSISDLISVTKPVIIAESFGDASDEAKMELFDTIHGHNYEIYFFRDFNINAAVEKINHRQEMLKWKETINICGQPLV